MSANAQQKAPAEYFDANVVTSIGKEAALFASKILAAVPAFAANPAGAPVSQDMRRLTDMVRIVGLRAVIRLLESARELAISIETGKMKGGAIEVDTLKKSISSAQRYLQNIASGRVDSGICLVPVAHELAKLAGGDAKSRLIEGEFFLPVMPRLAAENKAFNKAQFVADIKRYHAEFRFAMMEFVKTSLPESITAMRRELVTMEQKGPPASCRFFFSAAIAFFDIVIKNGGKIPQEHSPLLARIDKDLQKIGEGDVMTPDSTLSWLLYFIAQSEPASPRVERLKFIFALDEYLAASASLHLDESTLQNARNALDAARKAWESGFAEGGNPASVKPAVFALAAACNAIGDEALKTMGVAMGGLADGVASGKVKPIEKNAVFGASIMLQIEDRLERIMIDPAGGRAIANLQKERVRAVLSGKSPESVVEQKDGARAAYVKNILDEVASLISAAEQLIEQSLREPGKNSKVDEVSRVFSTAFGAMHMLSMKEAAEYVRICGDEVKRIMTKAGKSEEVTGAEKVRMAESIMVLTQFLGIANVSEGQAKQVIARGIALFEKKEEPAPQPEVAEAAPAGMETETCQDPEIGEIFFDEAEEIIGQIEEQAAILKAAPSHGDALKDVRRFFHTLKGGARMVELMHLGNVAWHVERTMNEWLAKKKPATPELLEWLLSAKDVFKTQIPLLRQGQKAQCAPAVFEARADQFLGLIDEPAKPAAAAPAPAAAAPAASPAAPEPDVVAAAPAQPQGPAETPPQALDFDIVVPDLDAPAPKAEIAEAAAPAAPATDAGLDFHVEIPAASPEPTVAADLSVDFPSLSLDPPAVESAVEPVIAADAQAAPAAPAASDAAPEPLKFELSLETLDAKPELSREPVSAPVAEVQPAVVEPTAVESKIESDMMALDFPALSLEEPATPVQEVGAEAAPAATVEESVIAMDSAEVIEVITESAPAFEPEKSVSTPVVEVDFLLDLPAAPAGDELTQEVAREGVTEGVTEIAQVATEEAAEVITETPAPAEVSAGLDLNIEIPGETVFEQAATAAAEAAPAEPLPVIESTMAGVAPAPDSDEIVVGDVRVQRQVFDVYVEESERFVDNLRSELNKFFDDENHVVGYDIMRYAHSIAGMGRTTGFTAITQLASAIESWASFHLDRPVALEDDLQSVLRDAMETLDAMVMSSRDGIEPIADQIILDRLNQVVESVGHNISTGSAEDAIARLSQVNEVVNDTGQSAEVAATAGAQAEVADASAPARVEDSFSLEAIEREIEMTSINLDSAQTQVSQGAAGPSEMVADNSVWIEIVHTKVDDIDKEAFNFFREEADELFPEIDRHIDALKENTNDREITNALKRAVHTLKGGANTAGARKIGGIFHFLEDLMGATALIDPATLTIVQSGVDASHAAMSAMIEGTSIEAAIMGGARDNKSLPELSTDPMVVPSSIDFLPLHGTAVVPSSLTRHFKKAEAPAVVRRSNEDEKDEASALKMTAKQLQRLVNVAGEVNIARGRSTEQSMRLRNRVTGMERSMQALAGYLRLIELEAEKQMEAGARKQGGASSKFDALEFDRFTRLQELTRRVAEAHNDITNQNNDMLLSINNIDDAMAEQGVLISELAGHLDRVRQVRISTVVTRLKRTVRSACRDAGKNADIVIDADVQIDRGILNKIMGSIEHILRNAIAHGIEMPEVRAKSGKDAGGMIELRVYHDGGETVIEIRDDGAGINTERVLKKAIEKGLTTADAKLTEDQIREFLFHPGFSTAEQVTELAGRGVGMDVVRSDISAMGGRISMWSQVGVGTQFTIRVPSTLTIIQGAATFINNVMYVMPAAFVSRIIRVDAKTLEESYQSGRLVYTDEETGEKTDCLFYGLWQMVGMSRHEGKVTQRNTVALMREHNVAVHVDDIMPSAEYVFKTMGPQVQAQSGLMGATVNGDGDAAMVIDPSRIARNMTLAKIAPVKEQARLDPLVMIVDDSITVRKMTSRLLSREGFRLMEAENGMIALEKLQSERPDVILLDIEMPVMDGFSCAQAIRNTNAIKDIPIIMITSRTAEKHRNHAMSLGVNEYLGKPYKDTELLEKIRHYVAQQSKRAAVAA